MTNKTSELAKEGVQSVGGFFRAFDIAFFMPGAIVLLASWWFRQDWWERPVKAFQSLNGSDNAAGWLLGLVFIVALIIATFVTGLFCHALARIAGAVIATPGKLLERVSPENEGIKRVSHPYKALVSWLFGHWWAPPSEKEHYEREASQLSLYLWNLSSLTWSLAIALLVVSFIAPEHHWYWRAGALAICLLGSDFRFWSKGLGGPRHAVRT